MLILEDELNILTNRENLNLDELVHKNEIQAQLNVFYDESVRGAQIRARIDQIEKGETNKKLYTSLEKHNQAANVIRRLKCADGSTTIDHSDILNEMGKFYQNFIKLI